MQKFTKRIALLVALICYLTILSGCFDEETIDTDIKKTIKNNDESYTLMIYMCASDLETEYGCATADINEIMYGYNDSGLNIIIQTGGALEWQNTVVSSESCQRYLVTEDGLELIDDTLGLQNMSDENTLSNFIQYCSDNYTASSYGLVLWDHGGGVIGGYGYDENFDGASMSLPQINNALETAGTYFNFIGFDACLMGTFETCLMAANHSNYLIASEEIEPGCGWYYTDWIEQLSLDASLSPKEYGVTIIDDYIKKAYTDSPSIYSTLAMFDLQKMVNNVLPAFNDFSLGANEMISNGEYRVISQSRSNSRAVYQSDFDHVDLYDFASQSGTSEASALMDAITNSIVYFQSTIKGNEDNGLSILFPYYDLSAVDTLKEIYQGIGYDTEYTGFIESFANVMVGGQISASASSNTQNTVDESEYSGFGWFDSSEYYDDSYYEDNSADLSELEITDVNGQWVLELSDEDWEVMNDVYMQMFTIGDGYYIDMGIDDYCEFDEAGNLIVEYDQTWVSLDGTVVPFFYEDYYEDDGYYNTYGYVPCIYNGVDSEIIVAWDTDNPDGYVAGVRPVYDETIAAKGLYEISEGDTFQIYYDTYDEDLSYIDTITIEDEIFVVSGTLKVSYEDTVSQLGDTLNYYVLEDIYNNIYYTESIWYN